MPMQKLAACFFLISALLIAGCGTQPTGREDTPTPETRLSLGELERRVGTILEAARDSDSPARERQLLNAAELLLHNGQPDWALNILQSIPAGGLTDADYIRYIDLASGAAISSGQHALAGELLDSERLRAMTLPPERYRALAERRATVASRLGDFSAALRERIRLGQRLTTAEDTEFNNEAIWQDLMSLPREELAVLAEDDSQALQQGWAQLALVARNNAANLNAQLAQLERWQQRWAGHPASEHLPTDLQLLRQLIAQQPRQIALLLPQEGRLANAAAAVRDGFLAAYFAAPLGATRPDIHHYDTSEGNILDIYQRAVDEGAELIIGPLDKAQVHTLAGASLQRPVLALNTLEREDRRAGAVPTGALDELDAALAMSPAAELAPRQENLTAPLAEDRLFAPRLYQFGLAVEDEARQVAHFARLEGHRNAMLIVADADWASRSADAFTDAWQDRGGRVLGRSSFVGTGDYSAVIKRALLIDQSEERYQQLRRILGKGPEFEPRRRQDVDMIFLVASPDQARQVKPTLAFHYAADLPVYATSQVYSGESGGADSDLAGIRFNTLPWLFDEQSPEKHTLSEHTDVPPAYLRLQAMGVDAYHLYPRLPQLRQLPGARVFGATGQLSLDAEGRIERELIWARFSRDGAELLPSVIDPQHSDETRRVLAP